MIPAAIAAAGVAALAAVLGVLAFGGGDSAAAPETLRSAGCTLQIVPVRYPGGAARGRHVEKLPKGFKYPSFPPTAGPHNPIAAPFDVYDEPVEQLRLVHNLEHGGITVQYGRGVSRQTVDRIVRWYRQNPNGIVVAPLPALGNTIALAAWNADLSSTGELRSERGMLAKCPRFDEGAFDAFMKEYAFKGPERFPKEQLAPGL